MLHTCCLLSGLISQEQGCCGWRRPLQQRPGFRPLSGPPGPSPPCCCPGSLEQSRSSVKMSVSVLDKCILWLRAHMRTVFGTWAQAELALSVHLLTRPGRFRSSAGLSSPTPVRHDRPAVRLSPRRCVTVPVCFLVSSTEVASEVTPETWCPHLRRPARAGGHVTWGKMRNRVVVFAVPERNDSCFFCFL